MALLNRTKTYTFKEFGELQRNEREYKFEIADKFLGSIMANKTLFPKVLFMTAIMLHVDQSVYAGSFGDSANRVGSLIVDMLMVVIRWGCIGMGLKNGITTLFDGGNLKDAINDGILYILAYLFFQLYPQFFELFSGIKF